MIMEVELINTPATWVGYAQALGTLSAVIVAIFIPLYRDRVWSKRYRHNRSHSENTALILIYWETSRMYVNFRSIHFGFNTRNADEIAKHITPIYEDSGAFPSEERLRTRLLPIVSMLPPCCAHAYTRAVSRYEYLVRAIVNFVEECRKKDITLQDGLRRPLLEMTTTQHLKIAWHGAYEGMKAAEHVWKEARKRQPDVDISKKNTTSFNDEAPGDSLAD